MLHVRLHWVREGVHVVGRRGHAGRVHHVRRVHGVGRVGVHVVWWIASHRVVHGWHGWEHGDVWRWHEGAGAGVHGLQQVWAVG